MQLSLIETIILSVVQAITELLPISSSGHLIIVNELLGIENQSTLLAFLHLPTALALLVSYRQYIFNVLKSQSIIKTGFRVSIAALPAIIIGLLLGDLIEEHLYTIPVVAIDLIIVGIMLILAENYKSRSKHRVDDLDEISYKQAVVIGLFQTLALVPGTSRSGITTIGGMVSGVNKQTAWDFSFIVGIPLLLGVAGYSTLSNYQTLQDTLGVYSIAAFIITFIVSLCAVEVVNYFKTRRFLTAFGVYRILLGVVLLILFV